MCVRYFKIILVEVQGKFTLRESCAVERAGPVTMFTDREPWVWH